MKQNIFVSLLCYFVRWPTDSMMSPWAVSSGSITAVVRQVPNQPIRFLVY